MSEYKSEHRGWERFNDYEWYKVLSPFAKAMLTYYTCPHHINHKNGKFYVNVSAAGYKPQICDECEHMAVYVTWEERDKLPLHPE